MKLGEFKAVDPCRIEFQIVNRDGQRMHDSMVFSVPDDAGPVRIEIHSLDDEWTESAPDGWGPGWPFRIGDTVMIAADDGRDQHESEILAFVPSTGRIQRANVLDIDAYGRKG